MYKCPCCETELVWQNDFDFEDYGREGEGIVGVYYCPGCNSDIEIYTPCGDPEKEGGEDEED